MYTNNEQSAKQQDKLETYDILLTDDVCYTSVVWERSSAPAARTKAVPHPVILISLALSPATKELRLKVTRSW